MDTSPMFSRATALARRPGVLALLGLLVLLVIPLTALPAVAQGLPPPQSTPLPPDEAPTATPRPRAPTATPTLRPPAATPTPAGPLVYVPLRIPSAEQAPGHTGTVTGRVIDIGGQAVAGLVVRLWVEQFSVLATTGDDGAYVFAGLAPGTYRLTIQDRESQIATVSFEPGEVVVLNFVQRVATPGAPQRAAPTATPSPAPRAPTARPTIGPSPSPAIMSSPTPSPRPTATLVPLPTPAPVVIAVPAALATPPARPQPRVTTPLDVFMRSFPWAEVVSPLLWGGLVGVILVGLLVLASLRRR